MENLNYKEEIEKATSEVILENLQIKYLGRKGIINKLFEEIKTLPKEKRREKGQKINEIKKEIETLIDRKKNELKKTQKEEFFDSTLPGKPYPKGSLHPLTYVIEEIVNIFQKIGFIRVSYPEVEWEYFSFEALDMPKGHPARDDFETFFIEAKEHQKFGKCRFIT